MTTAARVAIEKREHPERFCGAPGCLWRVRSVRTLGVTPCGKHGTAYLPALKSRMEWNGERPRT